LLSHSDWEAEQQLAAIDADLKPMEDVTAELRDRLGSVSWQK
jgi:hypothetical protein